MDYTARLDTLQSTIVSMIRGDATWQICRDLLKMLKNMRVLADQLSVAAVECRRLKQTTATFTALDAKFNEQYSEIEQWVTFAMLL